MHNDKALSTAWRVYVELTKAECREIWLGGNNPLAADQACAATLKQLCCPGPRMSGFPRGRV